MSRARAINLVLKMLCVSSCLVMPGFLSEFFIKRQISAIEQISSLSLLLGPGNFETH
jgi:hypothetical protein